MSDNVDLSEYGKVPTIQEALENLAFAFFAVGAKPPKKIILDKKSMEAYQAQFLPVSREVDDLTKGVKIAKQWVTGGTIEIEEG